MTVITSSTLTVALYKWSGHRFCPVCMPPVLVHSVFAPASDPYGFLQPVCGFVRFWGHDSGCVPIDDVIIGRDKVWTRFLTGGEIFWVSTTSNFLDLYNKNFSNLLTFEQSWWIWYKFEKPFYTICKCILLSLYSRWNGIGAYDEQKVDHFLICLLFRLHNYVIGQS